MAEETDSGPTRRRMGSQRKDAHAIERESRDHASASATASERGGTTGDAPVREGRPAAAPLPQRVTRKYYVTQASHNADERRVYADERGEYLVFKDQGDRLTTRRHDTTVVRDLIAVAVHRDWSALRVSGSDAFRREVWLEASARGIDVSGYTPSQLDQSALARRDEGRRRNPGRADVVRAPARVRAKEGDIALLQVATPLRGHQASATTSRTQLQDVVGFEDRVNAAMSLLDRGRETGEHRQLPSLRFGDIRDDATQAAAQSQIAVLERALDGALPTNAATREVVLRAARERIAFHLADGRALHRAVYRVPIHEKMQQSHRSSDRPMSQISQSRPHDRRDKER